MYFSRVHASTSESSESSGPPDYCDYGSQRPDHHPVLHRTELDFDVDNDKYKDNMIDSDFFWGSSSSDSASPTRDQGKYSDWSKRAENPTVPSGKKVEAAKWLHVSGLVNIDAGNPPSGKETKPEKQQPDWEAILFGGSEKYCDEILTVPDMDTYFVDCKLAEDAALNVVAKFDMPIFGSLRDFNVAQMNRALKKIPEHTFGTTEELIALVTVFDYLSCCCQMGSFFNLYDKSKDSRKRCHISTVDSNIRCLFNGLTASRLKLDQLHCVDRLLTSCIERLPRSLGMTYFSSKPALKRKITAYEMEEKSKQENSVYHFNDENPASPTGKKSQAWMKQNADFETFLKTPIKNDVTQSGWYSSTPVSTSSASQSGLSVPSSRSSEEVVSTSCPKGAKWLFFNDKEEDNSISSASHVSDKPIQKKLKFSMSKENASFQSSKQIKKQTSLVMTELEEKKKGKFQVKSRSLKSAYIEPKFDSDLTDDSLPDVPIVLAEKPISTSFSSPHKMINATWSRKIEPPSKSNKTVLDGMNPKTPSQLYSKEKAACSFPQNSFPVKVPLKSVQMPCKLISSSKCSNSCKCEKCQMKRFLIKTKPI